MKHFLILLFLPAELFCQSGFEIIKSSASKIKTIQNISYNIYEKNQESNISADITIERRSDLPIFDAKLKVNGIVINNSGSNYIQFSYDGQSFDFMDYKANLVTKLENPNYTKIGRTGLIQYTLLALPVYCQKDPFTQILQHQTKIERLNDTSIFNIPCFKVKVTMEISNEVIGRRLTESIWYFEKSSFLVFGQRTQHAETFLKIRSVNDKLDSSVFSLTNKVVVKKMTGLEPLKDGLLTVGTRAPEWSLPSSENKKINLADLKGKVVLLDFWGTWCIPCLRSMPDIQAIHNYFKNMPVIILGVSVEMEKHSDPVSYMKRKGYTYTTLLEGHLITKLYSVHEFPSIYIIDKNGFIIHAEHGTNRENFKAEIISIINQALN